MSEQRPIEHVDDAYCPTCGYALRGLTGTTCPECGRDFEPGDPGTYVTHTGEQSRPRSRTANILTILYLLILALTAYTAGTWIIWVGLPVIAAICVAIAGTRLRGPLAVSAITFSIVAASAVGLFCLAWVFDWAGTVTGSSTSALAFIFVPIYAVALGMFAALVAFFIAAFFADG